MLESIGLSTLLFVIYTLTLVPCGDLILRKVFKFNHPTLQLPLTYACGLVFFTALTPSLITLGLSNTLIRITLATLICASLFIALKNKRLLLFDKNSLQIHLVFFLYFLTIILVSLFPDGNIHSAEPRKIQDLLLSLIHI